jgi:hypothetical protein
MLVTGGQSGDIGGVLYFLLLVSLYWTLQAISGVVNATVAGVVGSWCVRGAIGYGISAIGYESKSTRAGTSLGGRVW